MKFISVLRTFSIALLFGAGLEISQMNQPRKVIGFLDVFNQWDPSLIFVMIGAILTNGLLYMIFIKKRRMDKEKGPLFASEFMLPQKKKGDFPLFIGSALFGIGWGLSGFCPGPALSGLFRLQSELILVAISIIAGFLLYEVSQRVKKN